jgi:4-hydroxybenzoate polyprenyltransferase
MGRLVIALDLAGAALLIGAAWLFSPILGLAVAGASCLATAYFIETRRIP